MGRAKTKYNVELSAARGQALGIQEHELAMIPIIAKAGEAQIATQKLAGQMQMDLQKSAAAALLTLEQQSFEQQMVQAEKLQLFADRVTEAEDIRQAGLLAKAPGQVSPSDIVAPGSVLPAAAGSKNLIYAALAIAAFYFLRS